MNKLNVVLNAFVVFQVCIVSEYFKNFQQYSSKVIGVTLEICLSRNSSSNNVKYFLAIALLVVLVDLVVLLPFEVK